MLQRTLVSGPICGQPTLALLLKLLLLVDECGNGRSRIDRLTTLSELQRYLLLLVLLRLQFPHFLGLLMRRAGLRRKLLLDLQARYLRWLLQLLRANLGQDLRLAAMVIQAIRLLSVLVRHASRDAMGTAHGKSFDNFLTARCWPVLLREVHSIGLRCLAIRAILLRNNADCSLTWMSV